MSRVTHVRRFYGRDDIDIWVDVRRVDEYVTSSGQGRDFQGIVHRLYWYDEDLNDNPKRNMTIVEIRNPQDETQVVEVPVIDQMFTVQRGLPRTQYQELSRKFMNAEGDTLRQSTPYRVTNRGVVEQPDANGFFSSYTLTDEEDDGQYLDVEVVESFTTTRGQGPDYQLTRHYMKHDLEDELFARSPADGNPLRLDPFQSIVNVQWGTGDNCAVAAMLVDDEKVLALSVSRDMENWQEVRLAVTSDPSTVVPKVVFDPVSKTFLVTGRVLGGTITFRSLPGSITQWAPMSNLNIEPPSYVGTFNTDLIAKRIYGSITYLHPARTRYASLFVSEDGGNTYELYGHLPQLTDQGVQDYFSIGQHYRRDAKIAKKGSVIVGGVPTPVWIRLNPDGDLGFPNPTGGAGGAYIDRPWCKNISLSFDDGVTWQLVPVATGTNPPFVYAVAAGPGVLLCLEGDNFYNAAQATNKIKRSTDGFNWETVLTRSVPGTFTTTSISAWTLGYASGKFFSVWGATFAGFLPAYIEVSDDGISWRRVHSIASSFQGTSATGRISFTS